MSVEAPQTPKPLRRAQKTEFFTQTNDSALNTWENDPNTEGVPELTRTETPSTEKYFPPTPNDRSIVNEPCLIDRSGSPRPKLKEIDHDAKPKFANESLYLTDLPTTRRLLRFDKGHNRPTTHLFQDTTLIVSQVNDENTKNKTYRPMPRLTLNANAISFNFSQLSPILDHPVSRSSPGFRYNTKSVYDTIIKAEEITNKPKSGLEAHQAQANRILDRPHISNLVKSTKKADSGQSLPLTDTQAAQHNQSASVQNRDCGIVQVGSTKINLVRILPYDTLRRLRDNPSHCISSKVRNPSSRCTQPRKRASKDTESLLTTLKELSHLNAWTAMPHIRFFIDNATCNQGQHRKLANVELDKLLSCMSKSYYEDPRSSKYADEIAVVNGWLAALASSSLSGTTDCDDVEQQPVATARYPGSFGRKRLDDAKRASTKAATEKGSVKAEQNSTGKRTLLHMTTQRPVSLPSMSTNTAIGQGFVQFIFKWRKGLSIEQILRYELIRPLSAVKDHIEGYIYIYWTRGNFGYVKVGVTAKSIEARLEQWVRKCGHEIESHDLIGSGSSKNSASIKIPHVYRVERLVHAELYRERLKESVCEGCGKGHDEWFRVSPEVAKKVVLKWSQWMRERQPYESRPEIASDAEIKDVSSSSHEATKTKHPGCKLKSSITEEGILQICQPSTRTLPDIKPQTSKRSSSASSKTSRPLRRSPRRSVGTVQIDLDFNLPSIFEA